MKSTHSFHSFLALTGSAFLLVAHSAYAQDRAWTGGTNSTWTTTTNWTGGTVATYGSTFTGRLTVNGTNAAVYDPGSGVTTTFTGAANARGLVVGGTTNGSLTITSGTLMINGTQNPLLSNNARGTLLINGGTLDLTGNSFALQLALGGTAANGSDFTISSGSFIGNGIDYSGNVNPTTSTLNLDGGTFGTTGFTRSVGNGPTTTINLNGGLLQARATNASFMNVFTGATVVVKSGGAKIDSQAFDITIAAPLTHDAGLGGTPDGGLTKSGTGILTLSGVNTYTGLTTISGAGTLKLDATGSINNSSGVALGTAGTFDVSAKSGGYTVARLTGSGTVVGALTVSTELAIGNSPGLVTYNGDLTLGAASTSTFEVTGGAITGDLGDVNGLLTITSGATLDLVQLGTFTANDKFTLFAYNSLSGTFAGLADDSTFTDAGGLWRIDYNDTTAGLNGGVGTSYITVTAIPEPGVALLGSLGLLVLLRRRKG